MATQHFITTDKAVLGVEARLAQCEKVTERYLSSCVGRYEQLHRELAVARDNRKKGRARADECTVYEVSEIPDFGQSIELLRESKVTEEFIRPLLQAQAYAFSESEGDAGEEDNVQKRRKKESAGER